MLTTSPRKKLTPRQRQKALRLFLQHHYSLYAPEKLEDTAFLPRILQRYRNNEAECVRRIRKKYATTQSRIG